MADRAIPNAESTAYPVWIIVQSEDSMVYLAGPWFSREAAEQHLAMYRYRIGKKAAVYCASGEMSDDYRHLCETGRLPDV